METETEKGKDAKLHDFRCPNCGRKMAPAASWGDDAVLENRPSYRGFWPCRCSGTVYNVAHEGGESWTEYQKRIAQEDGVSVRTVPYRLGE